jgi:hypothetical protein
MNEDYEQYGIHPLRKSKTLLNDESTNYNGKLLLREIALLSGVH